MTNVLSSCGTFEASGYCLFDSSGETVMTKFGTIAAACLAVALAASTPVLAQGRHGGGGFHAGGAHCAGGGMRGGGFRGGHGGFGPGIAAGVVAGAVIGGAGYYGSGYAPGYYGDSYAYDNGYDGAYDNGYNGGYDNGYSTRNGFVCQPGSLFRGEDGRTHLCQRAIFSAKKAAERPPFFQVMYWGGAQAE